MGSTWMPAGTEYVLPVVLGILALAGWAFVRLIKKACGND